MAAASLGTLQSSGFARTLTYEYLSISVLRLYLRQDICLNGQNSQRRNLNENGFVENGLFSTFIRKPSIFLVKRLSQISIRSNPYQDGLLVPRPSDTAAYSLVF